MSEELVRISTVARRAIESRDWAQVAICADELLRRDGNSAEGHFLKGLTEKVRKRPRRAIEAFETTLRLDSTRYDAAVELAKEYSVARRNGDAARLLAKYEDDLSNSPVYLDMAGTVYTEIGMPQKAWPLYQRATGLQPGVDLFQANLAACGVYLGKIEDAAAIYRALLERFPDHRRNHYQLARLKKATDHSHVEQMKDILRRGNDAPARNIFLYYAIGKELEDLQCWDESFEYYKKGGDAVCSVANYDIAKDLAVIDRIIDVCNSDWLANTDGDSADAAGDKTPIFIVGLPRTGTTLTERIISSHSRVESLGETQFLQMVLRRESGIQSVEQMTPEMVEAVSGTDMGKIAAGYIDAAAYRLGTTPMFIDKLPFNFLYLGFIARAWPDARIVSLTRNPMDSCFSMYKQVFTWAYKFSYDLEMLGTYYIAHARLQEHWRKVLGDRFVEVEYENLVADQENETRRLLDRVGLEFEEACLDFEKNVAPSTTASSVQVREKVHSGSIRKWKRYETHLEPLARILIEAGIEIE